MSQHCAGQIQSQNTVNILNMYVLQAVPAFSNIGFQEHRPLGCCFLGV